MLSEKKSEPENVLFKTETLAKSPINQDMTELNINMDEYIFLRKPTYDFQYLNFEFSENIHVFKLNNEQNSFIIKGKSNIKKITF